MKKRHGHPVGISILTAALLLVAGPALAQESGTLAGSGSEEELAEDGTVIGFEVSPAAVAEAADATSEAVGFDRATVRRAALAQAAGRGWYIGVRGGAYFDVDEPFVGVELLFPLVDRLWFNPNFEWVFIDRGDLYTINLDVHYDLPTHGPYMFWLGAGLALSRFDPPGPIEADTDPGLNLLAGLGFARTGLIPYVQAKALIDDGNTEFVLAGGLRF